MNRKDFIKKCIEFIESDTETRGEEFVSLQFMGAIFMVKVKVDGKRKTVHYSGAKNVLDGYRKIEI